ncbi:MAG: glycoside hydrolase family 28 protein [Oscillospiraceae bacterium]|jgi:galacturan 1,4-alpha-galacturonidase|nr:glycoside hydrolase family 28 protein [Oscillospiraceae bacterium]
MLSLTDYQAHAWGEDWTPAFAAAIDALCAQGGGTLTVPAGLYRAYGIRLYSNITLHLEAGAVLRFFEGPDGFALIDMEFEGITEPAYEPLLWARDAKNVRITGAGTLDGNGAQWWQAVREKTLQHPRPYLVFFDRCEDVVLEGVTLLNSPCWTVHPMACENVSVRGIAIHNPWDSPNTDGINPNRSRNVRISDCLIDVGDDCIAIKSGTEDTKDATPCENILISNCQMLNGHGGVVIGSEMSGGVRNVVVTGCVFQGTDRGIRVKTRRRRGGRIENLLFSHILMDRVMCPFVFNMYYFCGKDGKMRHVWDKAAYPVDAGTPGIFDVRIESVTATNATACAGFVYGLAEMPVTRLSLSDVTVTMRPGQPDRPAMMDDLPDMEARGFYLRNGRDIVLRNVRVVDAVGAAIDQENVTGELYEGSNQR